MLVTDLTNVRYLTGFTGTNGACVCGPGVRLFLTDFRYTERAAAEVEGWETVTIADDWLGGIAERLQGRVGFEDDQMSVRAAGETEEKLADGVEMVAAGGRVEELRRVKDDGELAAIAEASKLADEVWRWSLEQGLAGRDASARSPAPPKRGSASSAATRRSRRSSPPARTGPCRTPSRASGRSAAASWSSSTWARSSTATAPTAPAPSPPASPGEEARAVYEVVREAQQAALEAIRAGVKGEDVDGVAREVIDAAGHGEHFGHGLGHGVGLEVHEAPRLSPRSDDVLAAGEVVTVEPGIYLPGKLGVRIEDLVVVTEDGLRNLSSLPKELQIVELSAGPLSAHHSNSSQVLVRGRCRRMAQSRETLVSIHEEARRERLLDMEERVRRYRLACFGILAVALAVGGGSSVGYWWIAAARRRPRRLRGRRPLHAQQPAPGALGRRRLGGAAGPARRRGPASPAAPTSPVLVWFALPAVTLGFRFEPRGMVFGTALRDRDVPRGGGRCPTRTRPGSSASS